MKQIPTYITLGVTTYKTKKLAKDDYSVWQCRDIGYLHYLGEWTKKKLIKSLKIGILL